MENKEMGKKQLPLENYIPLLCFIAVICPLRADDLQGHSIRIEYFWTQLHKLYCGISWSNAEILFPLGAFALLLITLNFIFISFKLHRPSPFELSMCLFLQLTFRGFVDFYLITTYFPLWPGNINRYWAYPGFMWRLFAFIGGCASVIAVVFQVALLAKLTRRSVTMYNKTANIN